MKRFFRWLSAALMALVIMFAFSSCVPESEEKPSQTPSETEPATAEKTEEILSKSEFIEYYDCIYDAVMKNENPDIVRADVYNSDAPKEFKKGEIMMNAYGQCQVMLSKSVGFPFIDISVQARANPFANFNLIVDMGLLEKKEAPRGNEIEFDYRGTAISPYNLELCCVNMPVEQKVYAYNTTGCGEFLKNMIALSRTNKGNLNILTNNPAVHYSESDNCYYSFIIEYNNSDGYITALYMRSQDGKVIDDVTLQAMRIGFCTTNCAAGGGTGMAFRDLRYDFEILTLTTAIEQLLSGECYYTVYGGALPENHFSQVYYIPKEYTLKDCKVQFDKANYEGPNYYESFDLYTYRLNVQ